MVKIPTYLKNKIMTDNKILKEKLKYRNYRNQMGY